MTKLMDAVIVVTGSRSLTSRPEEVWAAFLDGMRELAPQIGPPPYRYLHGGARGVDQIVDERLIAASRDVLPPLLPDYPQHGRRAPIIRDEQLAEAADGLVAVWDGRSNGTWYTLSRARALGKPTVLRKIAPRTAVIGVQWTPLVNMLRVRCVCGSEFEHRSDRTWIACPRCRQRDSLHDLRARGDIVV